MVLFGQYLNTVFRLTDQIEQLVMCVERKLRNDSSLTGIEMLDYYFKIRFPQTFIVKKYSF